MKRRLYVLILAALVAGLAAFTWLPLLELASTIEFKILPIQAKRHHLERFVNSNGQTIFIAGTAHYLHLTSTEYPFWDLKRLILSIKPDLVLIEEREEAVQSKRLAEGPVEMPFCAQVAQENRIPIHGFDSWNRDGETREDEMADTIRVQTMTAKTTLVFTGYSHVRGLANRLASFGFQRSALSEGDKDQVFNLAVDQTYPTGLVAVLDKGIVAAGDPKSPFHSDEWIEARRRFVAMIKASPMGSVGTKPQAK